MLSDWLVSFVRTAVPVAWGSLVVWLLTLLPLDPAVAESLTGFAPVLTAVVIAGWYALTRWLEPRLPLWLRTVLFGSPHPPQYGVTDGGAHSLENFHAERDRLDNEPEAEE
ncbi:hypothetical protein [Occultella kanbiaonis]|uniref:hypothetical protein n=1 Tax=Occultella kanbiaonis TaxID=2675754 RepID=UPI001A986FDB|nr:hypothetical protein [Occultella kanbiaonis]